VAKIAIQRHGKRNCLRISPYGHGPDIEIFFKKMWNYSNGSQLKIVVEIVHKKIKEIL
jgi:hypothetical protein